MRTLTVLLGVWLLFTAATQAELYNEKYRAQNWGAYKGMTRAQVQSLEKAPKTAEYSGHLREFSQALWIWEYDFVSENMEHKKKIYFDGDKMVKEENWSNPIKKESVWN
jgi:hypothetical protein